MHIQEKCLPCIVNQALKVSDMAGLKEKDGLLRAVFSYLSGVDFKSASTPELIGEIFSLLKKETGNDDPYKETREHYNRLFLKQLPALEQAIDRSQQPFLQSIRYAIIGNIIDFNPIHSLQLSDIESYFVKLQGEALEIDDSGLLEAEIGQADTLLYLGDNCGEICLDKILVKKIKERNPSCRIFFAVRGAPVVNDSVVADAYAVGMDAYAEVISNGDHSLGTVLHRTSKEFQEIYRKADIIIAKGQANYECLSEENKNIFFLLMTKCRVIAEDIGVPEMKMICMKNRYST